MEQRTNLLEAIEGVKQRAITALDWCDTEISNLVSLIQTKQTELRSTKDELAAVKLENETLDLQINSLDLEITSLKREIALLKNPPVNPPPVDPPPIDPPPIDPPPPPPIEVAPDIEVSLEGIGSFRPGLKGDRQGNEIRYRGYINDEIDIIIDINGNDSATNPQIAICIERCHADLPTTAITLNTRLGIEIGSDIAYDKNFRLPPHARPRLVIHPNNPPKVNLQSLIAANLIPNYDLAAKPSEDDLVKIAKGSFPWETWQVKMSSNPYDPISEQYGQCINSWTGGAGPLMNEAHHLAPVQVAYLLSNDVRAWNEVLKLASSSGNYAVHYRLRDGRYPRADETGSLPFLRGDVPVTLKSASGIILPIPEPAHEHSLTYLAYLLTGERWYREELEAWHTYNVLTRPKNDLRLKGIVWSGQVRAAAWSLRSLLQAWHGFGESTYEYDKFESLGKEIRHNLNWMNQTFVNPSSSGYRSTGITSLEAFRPSPLLKFVNVIPKPPFVATWQSHVLASVLNECVRAGFQEALPIRDHVLGVVRGLWQYSLSPYHIGWGNHAVALDNWKEIIRTTFEGRTATDPPMNSFPAITTPDYIAWARSAVVAAVDAGQSWARDALAWIDTEAPKYKGGVPLPWRINPVGAKA